MCTYTGLVFSLERELSSAAASTHVWFCLAPGSYVAGDTPMANYVNVHAVLEERRKAARAAGPQVRVAF